MLWLAWLLRTLDAVGAYAWLSRAQTHNLNLWLDRIERIVANLAMARAAPHVRLALPRKGVCADAVKTSGLRRAIVGSALRRALRRSDLRARISALSRPISAIAAQVLKRLPRGLTRRRAIRVRRTDAPLVSVATLHVCAGADTS